MTDFRCPLPAIMPELRVPAIFDEAQDETNFDWEAVKERLVAMSKRRSKFFNKEEKPQSAKKSNSQKSKGDVKEPVFSTELKSSIVVENSGYVDVGTDNNFQDLQAKTSKLLMSDAKKKELYALAPGDQVNQIVPKLGKRASKKARQAERAKTAGPDWFGMKAPEMTEENRRDLELLQMRSALDPKRFYKKNDHEGLPKYFQIGHVVDSPVDFYTDRVPKKDRKRTLVDELLADAEARKYHKRRYTEIIMEKSKLQPRRGNFSKKKKQK